MDLSDDTKLTPDALAEKLFKTNGSYTDGDNFSKRYTAGVKDIVSKHFVSDQNAPEKQVIFCLSHSDGLNSFLKVFGAPKIHDPCYCCTVAVELQKNKD